MKAPCELMNKYVFPAVRGIVVTYMYKDLKMNQLNISKLLGISQSSVSRYVNSQRGVKAKQIMELPGFKEKLEELVKQLLNREIDGDSLLCEICKFMRENNYIEVIFPERKVSAR
ncbi:MAG: hypothetical protein DRJ35_00425 [Thermoprotei archaeon]|nr:MAG: hypothetical protein DRJ35_00425 [Thermoprotei archaeon]